MNVLHVTTTYPGPFVADLVSAEGQLGVVAHVVAPHRPGLPTDEAGLHRFRYGPDRMEVLVGRGGLLAAVRSPSGALMVIPFIVSLVAATARQARRHRPDVIHAHWWFPAGLAAMTAGRLLDIPYVVTLHGSDVALARRRVWRRLAALVLHRAAVVTADSQALADDMGVLVPTADIRVAAMPVPLVGEDHDLPVVSAPPPLRLLGVGRFTPEKGFDVLVAAVGLLAGEGVDVELDLVGDAQPDGPLANVRLRGRVSDDELHRLMKQAHAVVVPSRREGLGLVAVEALALGRPVVASRVGGLVETIEDGVDGLLVAPDDPVALADALRRVSSLPAPSASRIGRHRPAVAATAHVTCYTAACNGRGGG